MTVRANKPAFNIREKLKELTHNIGLKGRELMRAATVQEARDLVSAGRKNMVINGDMRISQRYGTIATTISSGNFVIDRYRCEDNTSGATTHQQVADAPPGFYNSLKVTVTSTDTSVAAGDFHYFRHIIEGNNINHLNWGSSNAKTVTLSFWVKSSVTGNHGASLWNGPFDRSFPFNYEINSANTWEHKSITIPGCPDGSWETGTARGINIGFIQSVGSTYTGTSNQWNSAGDIAPVNHVNLTATNGATWYITGIQLEVGKNATDFEHRSYGEELALCQRYYYRHATGTTGAGGAQPICNAVYYSTENAFGVVTFPTTMRDIPDLDQNGSVTGFQILRAGAHEDITTFTVQERSNTAFTLECSGLSGTVGHAGWFRTTSDIVASVPYLGFSAEI